VNRDDSCRTPVFAVFPKLGSICGELSFANGRNHGGNNQRVVMFILIIRDNESASSLSHAASIIVEFRDLKGRSLFQAAAFFII